MLTRSHEFAAVRQPRRPSPAEPAPVSSGILVTKLIRLRDKPMTKEIIERSQKRHAFADVALLTTAVALVVCLAIAATVVSIGIARADTFGDIAQGSGGRFAVTAFLGLVIASVGGLTAAMTRDGERRPSRD